MFPLIIIDDNFDWNSDCWMIWNIVCVFMFVTLKRKSAQKKMNFEWQQNNGLKCVCLFVCLCVCVCVCVCVYE
jgi:hypothetical protein